MSDRFDNLARAMAEPERIGRRRLLGKALAALGVGVGATMLGGEAAWATKPGGGGGGGGGGGATCPPGLTACGGLCRDLSSNSDNCGTCGNPCSNDSVCRNGVCVQVTCTCNPCPTGQTLCNGTCINTSSDNSNCGRCGTVCPSGTTCSNGACVQSQPQCTGPGDCPASTNPCTTAACTNGTCGFTPTVAGTSCPGGTCNGAGVCVSGCTSNVDCPPGTSCQNGTCVAGVCAPGMTRSCYSGPSGTANVGVCRSGTETCDSTGQWGTCTGEVLPQPEVCNGLDDDCDGVIDNGFDLKNDPNNCGTCGHVCSGPNATYGCNNGSCVIVTCEPGFIDCNGNAEDGCEFMGSTCP